MVSILYLLLLGSLPSVISKHPRPASPWVQSVKASCGPNRLEVSGYGGGRPLARRGIIMINARPIAGEDTAQLVNDISHERAVYRFQVLCGDPGWIILRIGWGEKPISGEVRYWSASAYFRGNKLKIYNRPEPSSIEGFWFR